MNTTKINLDREISDYGDVPAEEDVTDYLDAECIALEECEGISETSYVTIGTPPKRGRIEVTISADRERAEALLRDAVEYVWDTNAWGRHFNQSRATSRP